MLENTKDGLLDINCVDPLGRSALLMGIDNENLEIVELLLDNKVRDKIRHCELCVSFAGLLIRWVAIPLQQKCCYNFRF